MEKKTAVLIHGLHLQANDWEKIVFGDLDKNIFGNVPRGLEIALENNTELVYIGSGASDKDGLKECEYALLETKKRIPEYAKRFNINDLEISSLLDEKTYLDTKAKDTKEEIDNFLKLCLEKQIDELYFIPVAGQAPIAARRISKAIVENPQYAKYLHSYFICPSDTKYANLMMDDIVIFTPPHRGDRVDNPSHMLARRTLDVIQKFSKAKDQAGLEKFMNEWKELTDNNLN